jgi:hypothetical protein
VPSPVKLIRMSHPKPRNVHRRLCLHYTDSPSGTAGKRNWTTFSVFLLSCPLVLPDELKVRIFFGSLRSTSPSGFFDRLSVPWTKAFIFQRLQTCLAIFSDNSHRPKPQYPASFDVLLCISLYTTCHRDRFLRIRRAPLGFSQKSRTALKQNIITSSPGASG